MVRKEAGYTLVEALVAILVLGVVVVSIVNLFITIQQAQRQTALLESATRAAQYQIELLRNNNYNSLTPGDSIDFTNQLPAILPTNRSGITTVSEPSPGLRRIDVSVTYTDNGVQRQVNLSSLIGAIGITQ